MKDSGWIWCDSCCDKKDEFDSSGPDFHEVLCWTVSSSACGASTAQPVGRLDAKGFSRLSVYLGMIFEEVDFREPMCKDSVVNEKCSPMVPYEPIPCMCTFAGWKTDHKSFWIFFWKMFGLVFVVVDNAVGQACDWLGFRCGWWRLRLGLWLAWFSLWLMTP